MSLNPPLDLNLPDEIYDRYSSGWCMHMAAALHRQLGWKIQAVVTRDMTPNYIEHAWVTDPSGAHMLDADGYYPITMNGWPSPANTLHEDLTEDELKALTLAGCCFPEKFSDQKWNEEVDRALADITKSNVIKSLILKHRAPDTAKFEGKLPISRKTENTQSP